MKMTGTVKDGLIVLNLSGPLPEGARVEVEVFEAFDNLRSTLADLLEFQKSIKGWAEAHPGEFDAMLEEMEREEHQELQREIERGEW